jgi:8-oxo-dGTP pyrophosphatase MutT (NUDIX family)
MAPSVNLRPWQDPSLAERLRTSLRPVPTRCPPAPETNLIPAVVLIPLEWQADPPAWFLYVIRRSQAVPLHRGQIAFPGGVVRPEDAGPWDTVLREAWEEVGLPPEVPQPLGSLPPVRTVTDFWVCPIVAFLRRPWPVRLNRREVEAWIRVPLAELMDPNHYRWLEIRKGLDVYQGPCFQYGPYLIWGATARMIVSLLESLAEAYR